MTYINMNGLYNEYSYMKDYILPSSTSDLQQDLQSAYMNPEQTFHTPSFGDEEFDLLPLGLGQQGMDPAGNQSMNYIQHQQQMPQVHQMMAPPQQPLYVQNSAQVYQQPMYMTPMNSNEMGVGQNYDNGVGNNGVHHQQYEMDMSMVMGNGHPQQHNPSANVIMAESSTIAPSSQFLTTISQSQLSSQLGLHFGGVNHQPTNSSPRSNQTSSPGQETSEDSDDNVHQLGHLIGGMGTKRPSPEPVIGNSKAAAKKPKAAKKKKKRDPNEPQKPVSAYALFFRDTQAAIKGQNPNASFGEVSKIVASMWDTLDEDHKNVYKKRTECAKKEYLKQLAAYRASLVSKGATDHAESVYGASSSTTSISPAALSPPVSLAVSSSSNSYGMGSGPHYASSAVSSSTGGMVNVTSGMGGNSPPGELSPLQKKSPLLTSLMEGSNSNSVSSPPAHSSMSPPLANSQMHQMSPPSQQLQQQLHLQQHPPMRMISPHQIVHQQQQHQQQQQTSLTTAPYSTVGQGNLNMVQNVDGGEPQQLITFDQLGSGTCLRNGCGNPAVESSEWDNEYCSNDCVVDHCRDVFTAWVASHPGGNSYASVK